MGNHLKYQERNERIYSLDALRGIMMLLGLVIHSAITYGVIGYGEAWSLKDTNSTHLSFDLMVDFIHVFRMPVFMVAAGYFGALLFYKKGGAVMLRNRVNRILLPLAAGVVIVWPFIYCSFAFSIAVIAGAPNPLRLAAAEITSGKFLPYRTAHLWFIYYLFLFSIAGFLIATLFGRPGKLSDAINNVFRKITLHAGLRFLCSSVVVFLCLLLMGTGYLKTNNTFIIDWPVFFTYFIFYSTGWMLYRADCLKQLSKYAWVQLSLATILWMVKIFAPWPQQAWVLMVKQGIVAMSTSLFVFGFLALFLTYFHTYSRKLNYLMDSAYWVYIIHLPIVSFIPGLLAPFTLPVLVKFLIVFSVTAILSFVSYHYLVRGSMIGMFLNGKIHRIKIPPEAKLEIQ
jgi:glucans biosynthesis protein C